MMGNTDAIDKIPNVSCAQTIRTNRTAIRFCYGQLAITKRKKRTAAHANAATGHTCTLMALPIPRPMARTMGTVTSLVVVPALQAA